MDFYTVTKDGKPIFAALHDSTEHHPSLDRCVSLAVGDSATSMDPKDARSLGEMLIRASDALTATKG